MTVDKTTECSSLISSHSTPQQDVWEDLDPGLAWCGHAPKLGHLFGMVSTPFHVCRASQHAHQASGDVYVHVYVHGVFFLLPFHSQESFICHSLVKPGIPVSPSFYLTFHPTPHTPHIFIPIVFRGRSFQRPALSCTRRMGAGDILLGGVSGCHHTALWSAEDCRSGPANQMQGAPSFPLFFLLQYRQTEMPSTWVQGPIKQLQSYSEFKKVYFVLSQRMSERVCKPTA